jgi:uncharacterized protein Smg (DUF494 family)
MMSRLMDLVVLVTELIQENNKSYKEIDQELVRRGFSSEEIEQARFWMTAKPFGTFNDTYPSGRNVVRILNRWEQMSLDTESYGFLLRLMNLGIIDVEQFERIMMRISPIGSEKIPLGELKTIAGGVVFEQFGRDFENELFEELDDEITSS